MTLLQQLNAITGGHIININSKSDSTQISKSNLKEDSNHSYEKLNTSHGDQEKVLTLKPTAAVETPTMRRHWFASPKFALTCGMLEISLLTYILVYFNVVEGDFFRFGPPIQLFQYKIEKQSEYCAILAMFFIHQMMFTWLNEVVSPWMINEVQDPNVKHLTFSKPQTVFLINLYYVYFTLNSVILVNVSLSQLSFMVVMLLADLIATTTLNVYYIWHKECPRNLCPEKILEEGIAELKNF